jgi:hypothetical protein
MLKELYIEFFVYSVKPLQNPTIHVLVVDGGDILGWLTGPWTTEAKVRGIVPRAAGH